MKSGICQFNKLINYLRGCWVVIRIGLIEVHALLLGFADNRFEKYACGPNAQQNMTHHDPSPHIIFCQTVGKYFFAKMDNSLEILVKFPLTPMGVLAHHLRTLDRLLVPPSFVCRVTFKHLPLTLRSHI